MSPTLDENAETTATESVSHKIPVNDLVESPFDSSADDVTVTSTPGGEDSSSDFSDSPVVADPPTDPEAAVAEDSPSKPSAESSGVQTFSVPPALVSFSPETSIAKSSSDTTTATPPVDKQAAVEAPDPFSTSLNNSELTTADPVPATATAVIAGGVISETSTPPPASPTSDLGSSGSVVSGSFDSTAGGTVPPTGKKSRFKTLKFGIIVAAALLVLGGGGAAAYFGYYMNPSVIWSQSLGNMNSGYNKLISYLNTQSNTHYKGLNETGNFTLQDSGTSFNGSLNFKNDGNNETLSAKVDLGVANLDLEERAIKTAGNSEPDIYLQLNGIKSIGSYLGNDLGTQLDSLDGQWIEIDHNLLADIKNEVVKQQTTQNSPMLTWTDTYSFLKAASSVDQQYLFTTNSSTSVTKVIKNLGQQKLNGHNTYHYEVGFVPAHVKAYVTAMCSALQQSDLGAYIKSLTSEAVGTSSACKQLEASAAKIKTSYTVGVWVDTGTRMIYQVQVNSPGLSNTNAAVGFVDIGLNYKGGNSYPFFVSGQTKEGSSTYVYSLVTTLDESKNSVVLTIGANDTGSQQFKLTGNFALSPSNSTVKVTAPSGAEPLSTLLNSFGLGSYLTELQSAGSGDQLSTLTPKVNSNSGSLTEVQLLAGLLNSGLNLDNAAIK